ncbi:MAG: NAD(P)H-hydrate dehydratase [Chitinophagales bacterium]
MKLLTADQQRRAEAETITHAPIASIALMERAAEACTAAILKKFPSADFLVVCGMGNNGGDGLAIARLLAQQQCSSAIALIRHREKMSSDTRTNLNRLKEMNISITEISSEKQLQLHLTENTVIIDALLGNGINRPPDGLLRTTIESVNQSQYPVISIDVPSGLPIDSLPQKGDAIIRATYTLALHQPKRSFLFPESAPFTGSWEILDIGINTQSIADKEINTFFTTFEDLTPFLLPREQFSHKGTHGHALLISGSKGKVGAAVLAATACLHSGAGLLTLHAPECAYTILQTTTPEAMVSVDKNEEVITQLPDIGPYHAIGIGPGIGQNAETALVLKQLIQNSGAPLVLDADALNILAENRTWLSFLPAGTIITPHPKEFDRLTEKHQDSCSRLTSAQQLARKHQIYVVLKGAFTAVVCPNDKVWFNSTGNAALARGGSGDILTGLITGLLARGYSSFQSALLGTYLHGLAADLATKQIHPEALRLTQLFPYVSAAFEILYDGRK